MAFRLIVSDELQFTVTFSLVDGATERSFGARLSARRCPGQDFEKRMNTPGSTVGEFLDQQGLKFLDWTGDCPLVDEQGRPPVGGVEVLEAFMAISNMPALVMSQYMVANGAKAKLGN